MGFGQTRRKLRNILEIRLSILIFQAFLDRLRVEMALMSNNLTKCQAEGYSVNVLFLFIHLFIFFRQIIDWHRSHLDGSMSRFSLENGVSKQTNYRPTTLIVRKPRLSNYADFLYSK